jgi:hypothetical protein
MNINRASSSVAACLLAVLPAWASHAASGDESRDPWYRGEQEFRIGPRIGTGEIRIKQGQAIGTDVVDRNIKDDTAGIGGTVEYKAPFNLVIEAGAFSAGTFDWSNDNDYQLTEYFASVGFQVDLGRGFSLTPRVGRSRWKLESDDDWFRRRRDDDDNPAVRGYQNYWEISGMKRINRVWELGVSHRENHYDFGRDRSTVFTVMFNL